MSAVIKAQLKALHLRHPENGIPCEAAVVADWIDRRGRFVGYRLRFTGENQIRHLYFAEIRQLQEEA